MCCAHSGNKGRESGGGAAGSAAVEDVPAGQPKQCLRPKYWLGIRAGRAAAGQPGRGAGHATAKGE